MSRRPLLPLLALLGCGSTEETHPFVEGSAPAADGGAPAEGGPPAPDAAAPAPDVAAPPTRDLDILFMIDNSPTMAEEQDKLRRNFPVFMKALQAIPGGLPNVHIGVVTSDLGAGMKPLNNGGCPRVGGDRGVLQNGRQPIDCHLQGGARFISSGQNGTVNNFTGSIDEAFSCIATVGTQGCGYEHQLQSVRVALDAKATPENQGFLRDNAMLAIILITDEDDCSAAPDSDLFTDDQPYLMTTGSFRCAHTGHLCSGMTPPIAPFEAPLESCQANPAGRLVPIQELVASIRALKRLPDQQILVSGIFGWPLQEPGARYQYGLSRAGLDLLPVCQSATGEATPGLRLKAFVQSFGPAGVFTSICNDDFSPALQQVVAKMFERM